MRVLALKVIAFYLPQFHEIEENDKWWGSGFTEWVNVRKSTPLFDGHEQPRLPYEGNYYNLLDDDVKLWQATLAKQYGVYGFCYYHYWFNGKLLLEKPMEQMLANKAIDMPFCICWANEAWTRAWVGGSETLVPQHYGGEKEWEDHFDYLLPFLKDERYITEDGMPLVVIYRPEVIGCLKEMLAHWRYLARQAGLPGLKIAYQQVTADTTPGFSSQAFDYSIEFQPAYAMVFGDANKPWVKKTRFWGVLRSAKRLCHNLFERVTGEDLGRRAIERQGKLQTIDYDSIWDDILSMSPTSSKSLPGCYVGWDNTPRYGIKGMVHVGATPEKFRGYMSRMIRRSKEDYGSEYLFLTAWNEWAEGCIMEPDNIHGYAYLEALKGALEDCGEYPF